MQSVDLQSLILPALVSLGVTLVLSGGVRRLIVRMGWLDKPNFRKWHVGAVPLAGGLLIALSSVIVMGATGLWAYPAWQLWVGALMVFAIAFIDDRYPIRARFRLSVQLAAGLLVTASTGWVLRSLGPVLGGYEIHLGLVALPFTLLGIAALTNAINMTDGLDGMAGGVIASALFWLAMGFLLVAADVREAGNAGLADQAGGTARALAVLIGAILGFLAFNQRTPWRKTAAIFLGDGGSMMLGFTIAVLCVYLASGFGAAGVSPVAVGWIVAIPVIDLFSCILRRLMAGVTPMTPDRRHLHHLVMAAGLPASRAVPVLQVLCLLSGLVGIGGWRLGVPDAWLLYGLLLTFAVYFSVSLRLWKKFEPQADLVGRPLVSSTESEGSVAATATAARSATDVGQDADAAPATTARVDRRGRSYEVTTSSQVGRRAHSQIRGG